MYEKHRKVFLELERLKDDGILISVSMAGVSMLTGPTSWAEYGISSQDIRRKRMSKGSKFYVPDKVYSRLKSIERRMRSTLDEYSCMIEGFKPYRWMTFVSFDKKFKPRFITLEKEFKNLKNEIIENYEMYYRKFEDDNRRIARDAWNVLVLSNEDIIGVEYRGVRYSSLSTFESALFEYALRRFPTLERIENHLSISYDTAILQTNSDLLREQADAERARRELQVEQARTKAEIRAEQYVAESARYKAQHQIRMMHIEEEERQEIKRRVIEAETQKAREKIDEIGSPFDAVLSKIIQKVGEDVNSMLESIRKNGYVRGKIAQHGHSLLEFYELMKVSDNDRLREKLETLTREIGPIGNAETRSTDKVVSALEELQKTASEIADELTTEMNRASFIRL